MSFQMCPNRFGQSDAKRCDWKNDKDPHFPEKTNDLDLFLFVWQKPKTSPIKHPSQHMLCCRPNLLRFQNNPLTIFRRSVAAYSTIKVRTIQLVHNGYEGSIPKGAILLGLFSLVIKEDRHYESVQLLYAHVKASNGDTRCFLHGWSWEVGSAIPFRAHTQRVWAQTFCWSYRTSALLISYTSHFVTRSFSARFSYPVHLTSQQNWTTRQFDEWSIYRPT